MSTTTLSCGLCGCSIDAAPDTDISGTLLCQRCSAVPVLVAAYREGRARLRATADAGEVAA